MKIIKEKAKYNYSLFIFYILLCFVLYFIILLSAIIIKLRINIQKEDIREEEDEEGRLVQSLENNNNFRKECKENENIDNQQIWERKGEDNGNREEYNGKWRTKLKI